MNLDIALQILQIALALVRGQMAGDVGSGAAVAQYLEALVRTGASAYNNHLGRPIDPSLIKPEAAI